MHFSTLFAALVVASTWISVLALPIQARALTAPDIVANLNKMTTISLRLQIAANTINKLSDSLFHVVQGPYARIIEGHSQIINSIIQYTDAMQGTQQFDVESEDSIGDALNSFMQVHQDLLNIVIGKAATLKELSFVGPPLVSVLQQLKSVLDIFAVSLIDMCPENGPNFRDLLNSLNSNFGNAINMYNSRP